MSYQPQVTLSVAATPASETTELLIIRHGETAWNLERKLQGHANIPLNNEGARQAKALAYYLENEKLDAIFSSDLHRAMQTASEIARLQGIGTRLDSALRERCFGGFEGILKDDLPTLYPQEYAQWRSGDPDFQFPPSANDATYIGESTRQFHQRIIDTVHHYGQQFAGKKIAIVTHGGVLEALYREANQLPLHAKRTVTLYNGGINRFVWTNGKISLQTWAEISHLTQATLDEIH